jgi:hypothetical protein
LAHMRAVSLVGAVAVSIVNRVEVLNDEFPNYHREASS